ncbi:MAG: hypothetical protein JW768_14365 [Chitinispirillaceae bacterium]|nr:hypothetical protein [Chitinispirillaceae bacterium]
MSVDIMLITLMCALTLVAYMIAINAHGPVRLSLSYLLATILLAATVWVIVQHVNLGMDKEFKTLQMEKNKAEQRALSQEEALKTNKERMAFAAKLNTVITTGTALATSLINVDLQDRSSDLETLMGWSSENKKKVETFKQDFEKLSTADTFFTEPMILIREGIELLVESAQYYRQYYYSEDSDQEALRERLLRQKARNAYEKFQKASVLIASSG